MTQFVHTMGRVGSMALHAALQARSPQQEVYHSHLWTRLNLDHLTGLAVERGADGVGLWSVVEDSRRAAEAFRGVMERQEGAEIHTISRDPVARSVSLMFFLRDAIGLSISPGQNLFRAGWDAALMGETSDVLPWLFGAYRWHEGLEVPNHPLVTRVRHRQEDLASVEMAQVNVGRQGQATGLTLPPWMLDAIYSDPAVTRDYSANEIESFKQRWA